jgi:AraC-like DNA-binding protein
MVTPYQHLTYCRICHAKLLLSTEPMTVNEIAVACGYSDYTSFYHAFLHAEGITPSAFRQQARETAGEV